jgi:hypothetical protein
VERSEREWELSGTHACDVDELLERQRALGEVWPRENLGYHPVLQALLVLLPHVVVLLEDDESRRQT